LESFFNDATGIIIFTTVAGIVFGAVVTVNSGGIEDFISTGINEQTQINLVILREIGQFLLVALGGVAIGLAKHYND
jgi:NhaP-type Na+/H+ or K+/H+ antiporter